MAKNTGLILGILAVGGIAALALSSKPAAPAVAKAPAWWPSSVPFPQNKPANWPAGMAWPPDPNAPMPAGFIPFPMPAPVSPLPAPTSTCPLDANLPPDMAQLVNTILSAPQQTDPTSYDAVIQLLNQNNFPMAAACVQQRKAAGAPIQSA